MAGQANRGKRASGTFRRHFLLPLALLVGTFGLVLSVGFFRLTQAQDELQLAAEKRQVASALNSRLQALRRNLADYTVRDDAVRHLAFAFDREWAIENIAPYMHRVQHYDLVFVTDEAGNTLIASDGDLLTSERPANLLGKPFTVAMERLRHTRRGVDRRIAGITSVKGHAALFGIGAVVPSGKVLVPPGKDRFLTVVRLLDSSSLVTLGDEFGVEALHTETRELEEASLPLTDLLGRQVGTLDWESARPGSSLRERYTPHLIVMILLMAAVAGTVLRHGRRAIIDAIKARAAAERDAKTARQALRELDTARRHIADTKDEFATTLQQTVAAKEEEHDRLISSTLGQRRAEMIRVAEDYQKVIALVRDTLDEAAEALSDVARAPCGDISTTQLLASAGDLQAQARFLECESHQFLARLKAA